MSPPETAGAGTCRSVLDEAALGAPPSACVAGGTAAGTSAGMVELAVDVDVAGNDIGVPTTSVTTGASANGSFFADDDVADVFGATCVCASLTTGTRCTTLFVARDAGSARCGERAVCATGGNGARE